MLLPDEIVTVRRDRRIKQMHLNISYLGLASTYHLRNLQSQCTIFVFVLSAKNLMRMIGLLLALACPIYCRYENILHTHRSRS